MATCHSHLSFIQQCPQWISSEFFRKHWVRRSAKWSRHVPRAEFSAAHCRPPAAFPELQAQMNCFQLAMWQQMDAFVGRFGCQFGRKGSLDNGPSGSSLVITPPQQAFQADALSWILRILSLPAWLTHLRSCPHFPLCFPSWNQLLGFGLTTMGAALSSHRGGKAGPIGKGEFCGLWCRLAGMPDLIVSPGTR